MAKIEVDCRYKRELTAEEKSDADIERVIKGDDYSPESKYGYVKFTFDLSDVKNFNFADDTHVCVRFYGGDTAVILVNYKKFKALYSSLTNAIIHSESDYTIQ